MMLNYVGRLVQLSLGVVLACGLAAPAIAQTETLRQRLQADKVAEVVQQIGQNPALLDDPNYLSEHPMLARRLQNHPEDKEKIRQNPKAFFENLQKQAEEHLDD